MTPALFIARMRRERDPNWSDVQHLLDLVRSGDVIAAPAADSGAINAISNLSHAMQIADARHAARREAGE